MQKIETSLNILDFERAIKEFMSFTKGMDIPADGKLVGLEQNKDGEVVFTWETKLTPA